MAPTAWKGAVRAAGALGTAGGRHEHERQRDRGHQAEDGEERAAAHVTGRHGADQRSNAHRGAADQRQLAVHHGASPVNPRAEQGCRQDLGHRDPGHVLDVEAADGQERRHVIEKRDHHDRAAHPQEAGHERADDPESAQSEEEGKRHGRALPASIPMRRRVASPESPRNLRGSVAAHARPPRVARSAARQAPHRSDTDRLLDPGERLLALPVQVHGGRERRAAGS